MHLDLRQIPAQGAMSFALTEDLLDQWCEDLGFHAADGGAADLRHERRGAVVRVEGSLRGQVSGLCAHCGTSVQVPVDAAVGATFVPQGAITDLVDDLKDDSGRPGAQLGAELMEQEPYGGEVIDLMEWLRDEWRLGVPLALRCPDEVCREAADSNAEALMDPRWGALAALRDTLPRAE